jgi:type II secretory pathway pseudopilin PulG
LDYSFAGKVAVMSQYNPYGGGQPGQGASNFGAYGAAPQGTMPPSRGGMSATMIVVIVLGIFFFVTLICVGVLTALLLPAVSAARDAARQMQDSNNMRQIGLALLNYNDTHRTFPASFAYNSNGEKVWSWKVALLPYLEEGRQFQQIDFTNMKPWNDPSNTVLQGQSSLVFQSARADQANNSNAANVFLISSPLKLESGNAMFIDGEFPKLQDCSDGLANTMAAVMLAKHSAPWASPENLTPDEAFQLIKNEDRVFIAMFLDGSIRRLSVDIDKESFMALVTRDGGEFVNADEFGM